MKPARYHQVNDQEEVVCQLEHDAFSKPSQTQNSLPFRFSNWRLERPQHEGTTESDFLDGLIENTLFERLNVYRNVRKFRHKL